MFPFLALPSDVGQARGKQRGLPSSHFRISLPRQLPRGRLLGRTPGQGSPGSQHNSWNSRHSGHLHGLEFSRSGSLETWAAAPAWPWRGLEASSQPSLFHSCFLLCPAGLVLFALPGDSLRGSVEPSAHCSQLGHLQMGVFIGSGPSSLCRGVRSDGLTLLCSPLALFKVVAPRPGHRPPKTFHNVLGPGEAAHWHGLRPRGMPRPSGVLHTCLSGDLTRVPEAKGGHPLPQGPPDFYFVVL